MYSRAQPVYQCHLDESDHITSVNSWWLAFARENNAAGLDEVSVVGHVLWDFISGKATQALYLEFHEYVRTSGNSITVPFRCDSPSLQRYMQLTIHDELDGKLLYESKLIRAAPQFRVQLLDSKKKKSDVFLTMCSFCKRSLIEPSGWLDMQCISLHLKMFDQDSVPELRYTVCPKCSTQFKNKRQLTRQFTD